MSRHYPERPIVGVGAVILIEPDEAAGLGWTEALPTTGVVLVQRRFAPLAGMWSLPGGGLDLGETLVQGVAREVAEETGLTVEVGPIVDVLDRILLDADGRIEYHFVLVDYLCRPRGGQLAARSDVAAVTVTDPARLATDALTAGAADVIRKAYTHAVPR